MCGVMDGNVSSDSWHVATAGRNTRARQLEFRSTPPRWSVRTINAASSSQSTAGMGVSRASVYRALGGDDVMATEAARRARRENSRVVVRSGRR